MTVQAPDRFFIDGDVCHTYGGSIPWKKSYRRPVANTGLRRGYIASWEAINGKLFLRDLAIGTPELLFTRPSPEEILDVPDARFPIFADWVIDKFYLARKFHEPTPFASCGKRCIEVEKGIIKSDSSWPIISPREQRKSEVETIRLGVRRAGEEFFSAVLHDRLKARQRRESDPGGDEFDYDEAFYIELIRHIRITPVPASILNRGFERYFEDIRCAAIAKAWEECKTYLERNAYLRVFPYWADVKWRGRGDVYEDYVRWCNANVRDCDYVSYAYGRALEHSGGLRFHFRYARDLKRFADDWKEKNPTLNFADSEAGTVN